MVDAVKGELQDTYVFTHREESKEPRERLRQRRDRLLWRSPRVEISVESSSSSTLRDSRNSFQGGTSNLVSRGSASSQGSTQDTTPEIKEIRVLHSQLIPWNMAREKSTLMVTGMPLEVLRPHRTTQTSTQVPPSWAGQGLEKRTGKSQLLEQKRHVMCFRMSTAHIGLRNQTQA